MKWYGISPSFRLTVCLSLSIYLFAAVGPAGRRYRSIDAWLAPQQHRAAVRHAAANVGRATFSAYIGS